MKNQPWKPILRAVCAAAAATSLLSPVVSSAQSDDFNDGNDTAPVAWTEFDSIHTIFGPILGVDVQNTFSFPGGNTYQLQAAPSPVPGQMGPARIASFAPGVYTDFEVSADVVTWDSSFSQAFGLIARAGDFSTAGKPTMRGYGFIYVNGTASSPLDNFVAIFRLRNDVSTKGVHGSTPLALNKDGDTAEIHGLNLDPTKSYRFVFVGKDTHLEGRIYDLADLSTPVVVVSGNTAGESPIHTSGQCGLFAFNLANENGGLYSGPVDVTFDNYSAKAGDFSDNFEDGNDTEPAWEHYDPLGGLTAEPASFSVHDGVYEINEPAPLAPDAGPARVGSIVSGITLTDFYSSVDLIDWDDTVRQAFGIIARANDVGLGTTTGYLFSYELGSGALPNDTGGDTDISVIAGEAPSGLKTFPTGGSVHLTKGKQYRMVFMGHGNVLTGQIYDLADLTVPVITVTATDAQDRYPSGGIGLVVASQGSYAIGAHATFDNFHADADSPQLSLSIDPSTGAAVAKWPAQLSTIWVLESSPSVDPASAVWTEIKANRVVYEAGQKVHAQDLPAAESETTFFRLRKI